jgi:hypothetical protein
MIRLIFWQHFEGLVAWGIQNSWIVIVLGCFANNFTRAIILGLVINKQFLNLNVSFVLFCLVAIEMDQWHSFN